MTELVEQKLKEWSSKVNPENDFQYSVHDWEVKEFGERVALAVKKEVVDKINDLQYYESLDILALKMMFVNNKKLSIKTKKEILKVWSFFAELESLKKELLGNE